MDSDFYTDLPAPPGERVWVAAYVIDMQGNEFRSASEQTLLAPAGEEQTYHVSGDNAVSPVFAHKGVIWALVHETKLLVKDNTAWNKTHSFILRRSPDGNWNVITSVSGEPLQRIHMVKVIGPDVFLIGEERVYHWQGHARAWSVRVADYTDYFQERRLPVSASFVWTRSLDEFLARRVRLDRQSDLLVFEQGPEQNTREASGVHILSSLKVKKTFYLPQPTIADLQRYRPEIVDGFVRFLEGTGLGGIQNGIGPYVLDQGKLWFGLQFYGGEGSTGIGGIGSFDPKTGRWTIDHHPLLTRSSITALHRDRDVLWLGTLHHGERWSSPTNGLVRYDRRTRQAVSYLPKNSNICSWRITTVRRIGKEIWVGVGENGISVLNLYSGAWSNYAVFPNSAPASRIRSLGATCTGVRVAPTEH